eukprot:NODE_7986_length_408_cov_0.934844.p5 GENE.NODE_7986_length_408_cov_0.934844~~NODE_7986_length_408_cov_0.934844.p5  ORF type:complete len:61 (-),score=4.04 NODE_7986_length_408_cov_0.934844:76-258(-)
MFDPEWREWLKEYLKYVQNLQEMKQHHVHIETEEGRTPWRTASGRTARSCAKPTSRARDG